MMCQLPTQMGMGMDKMPSRTRQIQEVIIPMNKYEVEEHDDKQNDF